jgi:ABC-2 type transport system permease protein
MKQFLIITWWEFGRHFRSRSFLLSTFVSPLIFAAIIIIPSFYLDSNSNIQPRVIGCVEFDTSGVCQDIRDRLIESQFGKFFPPTIQFIPIKTDTSIYMRKRFEELANHKFEFDSLDDAYNKIKERRKYIFQQPNTPSRETLLKQTYGQLIQTRESRDLAQLVYQRRKNECDSLWRVEIVRNADQMLADLRLEGYLLVKPEEFAMGVVEFHSLFPANFLEIEPLQRAVEVVIVGQRLKREGMRVDKIQQWLEPIVFREIQQQGEEKHEFDFLVNYLGPIIVVLFLFISIFTSSGFLFSGVLKEKTNRVIEILLSSVSHNQLVAGKIFGLGMLGIFQIIIWYSIMLLLIGLDVINTSEVPFLNLKNAGLFLLYFMLGYFYFASIFVGIGSLFSNEEDAHHLNQFMRMLSIFPVVLAILVLEDPNSLLVRIFSFVPPLTPTFMILRTPLGHPPSQDYLISIGIIVISILLSVFFAGRLFRIGSLLYGKKPSFKEIFRIMFK